MDVHDIHVRGKGAIPGDRRSPTEATGPQAETPTSLVRAVRTGDEATDAKPLIAFRAETKPLTEEVDTTLSVEMQSLQVTFDINTVEAAIDFVKPLEVSFTETAAASICTDLLIMCCCVYL